MLTLQRLPPELSFEIFEYATPSFSISVLASLMKYYRETLLMRFRSLLQGSVFEVSHANNAVKFTMSADDIIHDDQIIEFTKMSESNYQRFHLDGLHTVHQRIVVGQEMIQIFADVYLGTKTFFCKSEKKPLQTDCVVHAAGLLHLGDEASGIIKFTTVATYLGGEWGAEESLDFVYYTMPVQWIFERCGPSQLYLKGFALDVWKAAKSFAEMCESDYPTRTLIGIEQNFAEELAL